MPRRLNTMYKPQIEEMAKKMDVPRTEALGHRLKYLRTEIKKESNYKASLEYELDKESEVTNAFLRQCVSTSNKTIDKLKKEHARLSMPPSQMLDQITDDDIEAARNYPIEQVIDFNRAGKAIAWCHEDKSPSLTWYKAKNKARCFACNQSFDSISAHMYLTGTDFITTVKALSR